MATKYNTTNSTDFSTAIGGAPGVGDTVNINQFASDFDAGLSVGTNKAALIKLHPKSQCEFAKSGGLVCQTAELVNYGTQNKFIVGAPSSAGEIDLFVNAPARGTSVTQFGPALVSNGIYSSSGTLTILDTVDTAGDVEVSGGETVIMYSATFLIDGVFRVHAGVGRCDRRAEAAEIGGTGTAVYSQASATQGDITQEGGTIIFEDSGAIDSYVGLAGTIDFTKLSRPITFASWEERPGLTILMSRRTPTITRTSSAAPYGPARTVYVD